MLDQIIETNLVPDPILRLSIRTLLKSRLKELSSKDQSYQKDYREMLSASPIAVETDKANEQHYEVPSEFFVKTLGQRLKYSCALWDKANNLDEAEIEMLELYLERAQLKDGQKILELGCGWGSLSLFMAERLPNAEITVLSNSRTQKEFIDSQAKKKGFNNLTVMTSNVAEFDTDETYDRVISIEMFEHMRNYEKLFSNVSKWLNEEGKLFIHIFVHKDTPYLFEVRSEADWMAKYFFSGGQMPSYELFRSFDQDLKVQQSWKVNGEHYYKTCMAWLKLMDSKKSDVNRIFKETYGKDQVRKWTAYWRIFYMACAELFHFNQGEEWFVGHYLLEKSSGPTKKP